jgi:ATP-dependent helicase/nuclease subunit B
MPPAAECTQGRLYTVPPGQPFLAALAEALLTGNLPAAGGAPPGPLQLADTTLLLPTRRAQRALQDASLTAAGGRALLLPKIRPLSEGEEDIELFADGGDLATGAGGLPRVVSPLWRQLVLTQLVFRWAERDRADDGGGITPYSATGVGTPAQAARLARELARLMDLLETEGVDAARLGSLVPEELTEQWQQTLQFLTIVTHFWPEHLADTNHISPVTQRRLLLRAEIDRLKASPPKAPVIVAGITALDPVGRELARAVLDLPNGAVVLPALDQDMDEESWAAITPRHPEHPQFGLSRLLSALGVAREDVRVLPGLSSTPTQRARAALVSETMRPAETTERWHRFTAAATGHDMAQALDGVSVLEAPSAEEEAEAIALILREAAETPGRTAALVTPDPALARRVSARLEAWKLAVPPTVGMPFAGTLTGAFLDLVAEAAAQDFAPQAMMALLRHPLCRAGLAAEQAQRGARTLELAVFRTPYFGKGLAGIDFALAAAQAYGTGKRRHRAVQRLEPADWTAAHTLLAAIQSAYRPLAPLFAASGERHALRDLIEAHAHAAAALAGGSLWQGTAGDWGAKFLAGLLDPRLAAPAMLAAEYPDFYRTLAAEKSIRAGGLSHPRLAIWDPFEARLQQPDVVVLGALNESTWPAGAEPGPWLSRPMRAGLGLPAPEERIGAAAHDFASLLCAQRVYLTRAAKVDGTPTVPSRWLLRLQALLGGLEHGSTRQPPWLAWAQARNRIDGPVRPVAAPEPRPALALRPRKLSVTAIERWIANPYALYAQRILGLEPLPLLGRRPDAALKGEIVHDALGRFAKRFPDRLPADVAGELVSLAEAALAELTGSPRVAAFWAPRFARFAQWFAESEPERRKAMGAILAEVEGGLILEGPAGPFELTARADRIDVGKTGLIVTDYKTKADLTDLVSKARQGLAPQLALEAAIAIDGGFTGLAAGPVTELRYISASGGEPPGQQRSLDVPDVSAHARTARDGLLRLIADFDRQTTAYPALRRARFSYRFDDYAHLARIAEWSAEVVEEA